MFTALDSIPPLVNSFVILVVTAIGTFLWARYRYGRTARDKVTEAREKATNERDAKIAELERKLALVDQTVTPIAMAMQAVLIKKLTHFHEPETDALLVKVGPPYDLTDDEAGRLAELLIERELVLNGSIDEAERDAAHILPAVIRMARAEAAGGTTVIQTVAVPHTLPDEETKGAV